MASLGRMLVLMSKLELPFQKLFYTTTPKDFITIFNFEQPQIKAFILSFSPYKSYVKRVLRLLDLQESHELDPCKWSSTVIRDYLQRSFGDTSDLTFVKAVEDEVNTMVADYENLSDLRHTRKRLFFRQPRNVLVLQKKQKQRKNRSNLFWYIVHLLKDIMYPEE